MKQDAPLGPQSLLVELLVKSPVGSILRRGEREKERERESERERERGVGRRVLGRSLKATRAGPTGRGEVGRCSGAEGESLIRLGNSILITRLGLEGRC